MTLEEYIDQKRKEESKYDFIDRDFLNYFTLTWRFNHLPINVSEEYIEESTNLYSGQIEQANLIDSKFKNITNRENQTLKISKNEFKDIANVYFDNIYIHLFFIKNDEYATYKDSDNKYNDYNEIRWNAERKTFNFIEINVYIKKTSNTIKDLILHELRHYFDDYNSFKTCNTILDIAKNNSKYKRFNYVDSDNVFDENVKQINNILSNIEQHAYIGQLLGQITDILKHKKYKSIYQAIVELIKSKEYKKYKNLKKFVINIIHDKNLQTKYIESYRKITHTSLSDSKIIEQLNNKFNKFWFTLQKGIYQYIEKNHIVNESLLSVSTKNFIKQL